MKERQLTHAPVTGISSPYLHLVTESGYSKRFEDMSNRIPRVDSNGRDYSESTRRNMTITAMLKEDLAAESKERRDRFRALYKERRR